jgi:hypothetical protein
VTQLADNFLDIVSRSPAVLWRRVLLTLPVAMACFSSFFEASGQLLAKSGKVISELLPGRVPGKWQLRVAAIHLIPPIGDPFRTIENKSAKFRQSIHSRRGWSIFVEQLPCYFRGNRVTEREKIGTAAGAMERRSPVSSV